MTDLGDDALLPHLRAGIQDGEFVTDGKIMPERNLALRLNVGRARLRRALDVLEAEGVIFRRHGQGTFAAPPPAVETRRFGTLARQVTPRDIMEVRLEVEPALAALTAQRASRDDIQLLERMMRATLAAQDSTAYETTDDIFHFKIAEIADNPLFLTVYQSIRAVRKHAQWTSRRKLTHSPTMIKRLGEQHEELFSHIAAHNSAAAADVMEKHLITVSNTMLRDRSFEIRSVG